MDENEKQLNEKGLKVLRTYTSDMAEAIRKNEVSVIKIALAEKEKREQEEMMKEAGGTNTSKALLVVGGIILIAAAIVGSYFLIQKKKEKDTPTPIMNNVETFISYDSSSYLDTTNIGNIIELLSAIKQTEKPNPGLVKALFLTKKTSGVPEMITSNDFLSLVDTMAPGALTRSLSDKYLLGKYSNGGATREEDKTAMFLVFETTNYNLAYASLLDWEKTMFKDLFMLFNINIPESDNSLFEKQWKDIIINNKDARVLYGEDGEGILYYVFINKNRFVVTSSVEALKEVMSRLIIKNAKTI